MNGLNALGKRREAESFGREGLDVMEIQETSTKGCGVMDCTLGSDREVWEGMEGRMVWCVVDDNSKGRGKEGSAFLMYLRVWEGIEAHVWKGSRIVWAVEKVGIVKYAWVCVYAPLKGRSGKG